MILAVSKCIRCGTDLGEEVRAKQWKEHWRQGMCKYMEVDYNGKNIKV